MKNTFLNDDDNSMNYSFISIMFFGLLVSGAIKDFQAHQGIKEKKALKELSKLDLDLKSSKLSSWLLIESFLLRLSSL